MMSELAHKALAHAEDIGVIEYGINGHFMDADLSKAEIVDAKPVNCSDGETGELIKDYNG